MLVDSDVSLDAPHYLGKRMDGMSKAKCSQILVVNNSADAFTGVLMLFTYFYSEL